MNMRLLFCIALLLQVLAWFPATSRLLPLNHHTSQQSGTRITTQSVKASYSGTPQDSQGSQEGSYRGMNQLGSRPPNCEHKCDSCNPCIAIQVPTMTGRLGIQFANYEPEVWKCKCGLSVYSP